MPTKIIPHNTPVENATICRYCGKPLQQVTTRGGSPGGTESDYATLDGNTWCNSAGNCLTREEWLRQPRPTFEQWQSGEYNFSPCQYHEPTSNRIETELAA